VTNTAKVLALVLYCHTAAAATWFVSPRGNDANSGLGPDDRQALETIQAGVGRLRPGDTLLVRGGVYRETVVFPRSGAPGRPLVVKAYPGETAVISGCDPIAGWTRHKGNIWKAPMGWTLGRGRNQVFADGQVLIEARFPNRPAPGLEMYVAGLSPLWPTFGEFSISDPVHRPGRVTSRLLDGQPADYWKGAIYYGIHAEGWCGQTGVIESSQPGEIHVGDRTNGWWFAGPYQPEEGRGMIVGHMNALDQPGGWHWQQNTLYLIPPRGIAPGRVEAKRRQLAFDLSGREHIRIEGLAVEAASMRLEDSAWCVVDRCRLSYIAHFTHQYDMGQVARGRDTIKSGETGIFIGGHDNTFLNSSVRVSAGAGFHLRGYHHTIHNCLIDEVSYTAHYLNAITDAVSDFADYENFRVGGHEITFNTLRNAGRHFFNFYGNGTSQASRTRGPMDYAATLFAHNHLYNGMLQTKDAGLLTGYFGSGGTLNGQSSQVAYNVLHDSYDIFGMRIGALGLIYLDEGTCDVDVHHNLLWAAPGSLQRGLWFNTCCVNVRDRDNVFHREFAGDSGSLRPEDFPGGRPFRFGHDFACPPAVPPWPQVVARRLAKEQGRSSLQDGDWCRFETVDWGAGWRTAVLRLASSSRPMNTDTSARAAPRHRKATDPLVLEMDNNDGTEEHVRKQWTFLYDIGQRAWVRFHQVRLGAGYRRFRAVYGNNAAAPWRLEVRLDRADGPLAGQATLAQTDRLRGPLVQIFSEAVGDLSAAAAGTRDVFLVFRSEAGKPSVNFEYLRFEQSRAAIPLLKNEVQLEIRLGRRDGPKIGVFYPRYTGGALREFVAGLEPAQGRQPLFLVVRSALGEPIGTIAGLDLEKAAPPGDPGGLGQAPRSDRHGRMILPPPTNRPRARPADRYQEELASRRGPRPIFAAVRLKSPPALDGQLEQWTSRTRPMTLAETCDGSPSPCPKSTAWVGYDDQALYVAARHPVTSMAALAANRHLWDQSDGMEVALQDARTPSAPPLSWRGFADGARPAAGDGVTYRTRTEEHAWCCQWRIPFAACGFTPRTAPQLRFNLAVRHSAEDDWACWRGTGAATSNVALAGTLVFPKELAARSSPPREGLIVWLDAADAATVQRDALGKVVAWKDKSGKTGSARQEVPQHRPFYAAGALGGRPAIRFTEKAATRLELPDLSEGKITATVFAVFSNPAPGDPVNAHPRIFTASDGRRYDYQVGISLNVPGLETGGPRQIMATFEDRWAKNVRVGCFSPNYQTFFTGDIGEILVYRRPLTPQEKEQIGVYLFCKWALWSD
jgi:hypothetical protein